MKKHSLLFASLSLCFMLLPTLATARLSPTRRFHHVEHVKRQETASSGSDGSQVTTDDGKTFTYNNKFGGTWTSVPGDNSARAQKDVPPLSQDWDYQNDRIQGVNLGGWLVTEPFISPALYEPYANHSRPAVDEYVLSQKLGQDLAETLTQHYETFITEQDFAMIASAGLNWIRLPVGFWLVETWDGEPFLEGVAFEYMVKALTWARKYGIRVNLDLHAVPGSQNAYNHSGKLDVFGFLKGTQGLINAQRTINYIRTLTQFISQDYWAPVVPMWSIMNEPRASEIGTDVLQSFYSEIYEMIRNNITGVTKGPYIGLSDAFIGQQAWEGFLEGADRVALDDHPYLCFAEVANDDPMEVQIGKPCGWGAGFNRSTNNFGLSISGEWSLAINDCGHYLNGVNLGNRYEANGDYTDLPRMGSCDKWNDFESWSDELKLQFAEFALASMDAMGNFFFWTWNIGNSSLTNAPVNPMWSYKLGVQQGYAPSNPRDAHGACQRLSKKYGFEYEVLPVTKALDPNQVGEDENAKPSSTIQFPPTQFAASAALTPTGTPITLSATPTATGMGNGWANPNDDAGYYVGVEGCKYPNPYFTGAQPTCN